MVETEDCGENGASSKRESLPCIPLGALNSIKEKYTPLGLKVSAGDNNNYHFESIGMTQDSIKDFYVDYNFLKLNPYMPIDHVCSSLGNFHPKNESQKKLLNYAKKISSSNIEEKSRGLYIYGPTGTGKTHIAVGIGKTLLTNRGLDTKILPFLYEDQAITEKFAPQQVWIIPHIGDGIARFFTFMEAVENAWENNGLVIATGYKKLEDIFYNAKQDHGLDENEVNIAKRVEDICKNIFDSYEVRGDSQRGFGRCDHLENKIKSHDKSKTNIEEIYSIPHLETILEIYEQHDKFEDCIKISNRIAKLKRICSLMDRPFKIREDIP